MDWHQMLRLAAALNPNPVMQQSPTQEGLDPRTGVWTDVWGPHQDTPRGAIPINPAPPIVPTATTPWEGVEPPVSAGLPINDPEQDMFGRLMQMYQPEHRASDILLQMAQNPPHREKPGIGRMILGGLAALGTQDPAITDRTMNRGYYDKVEDYNNRLGVLKALSADERYTNTNERALALGAIQNEIRDRRERDYRLGIESQNAKREADIQRDKNKSDLQRKKLELEQLKYENPNLIFKTGQDGYIYGMDPATGQGYKTEVKGTDLNDIEKLRIIHDYRMSEIDRRIAGQESVARIRGKEARETKTTPTGAKSGSGGNAKPMSELEKQRIRRSNAVKIMTDNPEFAKGIMFDDNKLPYIKKGYFDNTPNPNNPGGLSDEQYIAQRLQNGIPREPITDPNTGGASVTTHKPDVTGKNPNTRGAGINQPEGKIEVISPQGVHGWIPMKQLEAALKQGYKKVR